MYYASYFAGPNNRVKYFKEKQDISGANYVSHFSTNINFRYIFPCLKPLQKISEKQCIYFNVYDMLDSFICSFDNGILNNEVIE